MLITVLYCHSPPTHATLKPNIQIGRAYFDRENEKSVIKASICNGEQIAGFKNIHTGKMREIMLIKTSADLEYFKTMYGIETEIEKEY